MSFDVFFRDNGWFITDGAVLFGPYRSPHAAQSSADRLNELRETAALDLLELLERAWPAPSLTADPNLEANP